MYWSIGLRFFFLMTTIDLIDVFCRQSIIGIDPIDVFLTIGAQLWRLLPFKFGDNPRQVSFAKHARRFQQSAQLHKFFKNWSCQGLSPNPSRDRGHPKNRNHNAIWPVWIFVHPFWAVQCRTKISKNEGSHHRWSGRCVCIYGRLMCRFSGQANTPPPSKGFFHSFGRQWPCHQFEKNVCLQHLLLRSLVTRFWRQERPLQPIMPPK